MSLIRLARLGLAGSSLHSGEDSLLPGSSISLSENSMPHSPTYFIAVRLFHLVHSLITLLFAFVLFEQSLFGPSRKVLLDQVWTFTETREIRLFPNSLKYDRLSVLQHFQLIILHVRMYVMLLWDAITFEQIIRSSWNFAPGLVVAKCSSSSIFSNNCCIEVDESLNVAMGMKIELKFVSSTFRDTEHRTFIFLLATCCWYP